MEDHDKLVSILKEVDIVISVLAIPQVLEQHKIIEAIKVAGNIKRFLPSDFGVEEDRVAALPPFQAVLEKKRKIRRAIEAANIPYTFVSANCFASYFVNYLLHPTEQKQEITVYGTGEAKAVMNYEEDIGILTIKVATDPRMCNRVVIYRPTCNIVTQLELIALWEKKTGRVFNRVHVPEEELVSLSESVTINFDLEENEVEASAFYPELKLTTVDELLDIFISNPPKPASAAF
ncbi:Isoflavone reductase homolog P3 [Striga hermonthica]|uniref:Isoflavone reductase homolog P3 n=1 Tax=Striga hermonthica TaxID=68872 RepID=A0A9N7R3T2_STRHE|nr:Isoflavone reductase homolog P3 [Striga hermonthica]